MMRLALPLIAALAIGPIAQPAQAKGPSGRQLTKICKTCHEYTKDGTIFGPHLMNILDRPVASVAGFEYTEALKGLGGVWTRERLIEFLTDPQKFAPGNNMKYLGTQNRRHAETATDYIIRRTRPRN